MDIVFLLDRSGSMRGMEEDTIGGYNSYLNGQRKKDVKVTTVLFDDQYEVLHQRENIKNVNVGDYILLSHGRWSSSIKCTIKGIQKTIWYISPKSYKEGALAVSHKMPDCLKQYGFTEE